MCCTLSAGGLPRSCRVGGRPTGFLARCTPCACGPGTPRSRPSESAGMVVSNGPLAFLSYRRCGKAPFVLKTTPSLCTGVRCSASQRIRIVGVKILRMPQEKSRFQETCHDFGVTSRRPSCYHALSARPKSLSRQPCRSRRLTKEDFEVCDYEVFTCHSLRGRRQW